MTSSEKTVPESAAEEYVFFIKTSVPYKIWSDLDTSDFESIWITANPPALPRDNPNLTVGAIYHPPQSDHRAMNEHIACSLDKILSVHPSTGLIVTGDFNQLPEWTIKSSFKLKQVVDFATRENAILDKLFTNLDKFYLPPQKAPQIGKSDHFSIVFSPRISVAYDRGNTVLQQSCTMGNNEKNTFVHELKQVKWEPMYSMSTCKEQFQFFDSTMNALLEKNFPKKVTKTHTKDKPWINESFKLLIKQRQRALKSGQMTQYHRLRNKINRENRTLRENFYKTKIKHLSNNEAKAWWKNTKDLLGLSKSGQNNEIASLANTTCDGNIEKLAENINDFFESVSSDLPPLEPNNEFSNIICTVPSDFIISVSEVEDSLARIKLGKAAGPDRLQAWILRDMAPILAPPICALFNSSLRDGYVPETWKTAHVTALPKKHPPRIISKDLRPISLTSLLAKELERFVMKFLRKATQNKLDQHQFGNKKGISTTHLLVELVDNWLRALEKPNSCVRVVFLDYTKAFDRINHHILMDKIQSFSPHPCIVRWIAAFLEGRQQRVRLGDVLSSQKHIKGSVPQGAILGMETFEIMIDDLKSDLDMYKYVDDTTLYEILNHLSQISVIQDALNDAVSWTKENDMVVNTAKTHEMIITRSKNTDFSQLTIEGTPIETVSCAKLVGLYIQSDLKWNSHIDSIIKKAHPRLYFLAQLRRARVSPEDMLKFYITVIRPVLEYAAPVWSTSLPEYLNYKLEQIQKRALRTIYPSLKYDQALDTSGLETLQLRRTNLCKNFFRKIQNETDRINHLLPPIRNPSYELRRFSKYIMPKIRTEQYKNSFIPFCLKNYA